eukprot:1529210-Karenia_brevis.AAC.1
MFVDALEPFLVSLEGIAALEDPGTCLVRACADDLAAVVPHLHTSKISDYSLVRAVPGWT